MTSMMLSRIAIRPSVTLCRSLSSLERYKALSKKDASKILLGAKQKSSLTYKELSEKLQVNKVCTVVYLISY